MGTHFALLICSALPPSLSITPTTSLKHGNLVLRQAGQCQYDLWQVL
jgi:hypothetical protein